MTRASSGGDEVQTPLLSSLLSSSVAGAVARVVCHPLDTLKAKLQSGIGEKNNPVQSLYRGLYRGLAPAIVGGVPASCIYLTTYDVAKGMLTDAPVIRESPFAVHFCAGMLAEAISCVVFVPTDVVKERLQVGMIEVSFAKILATEGLRGLYRGYGASLLSFGPFSALYFAFYEGIKKRNGGGGAVTFANSLCSSAVAGAAASFITSPLDLVKLRLQLGPTAGGPATTLAMLRFVHQREGSRGLFRGSLSRVLFHTPNVAITMAAFEACKTWLTP